MVQTKLEPESADFTIEKPALVQAMALVENGGDRSIVQWGQAVALRAPEDHGGRLRTTSTTSTITTSS